MEKATFAAGCFWGIEETFRCVEGVISTRVGYTGGDFPNPTYEDVCSGITGHSEAVEVEFDPLKISYNDLLDIFWSVHNPTLSHKAQYKSAIFFHSPEQKTQAEASKEKIQNLYKAIIQTEILPAQKFYPAEEYHQKYNAKHGRAKCSISQ